ncbi:MAG: pyridoxamine 5-phosphate oxidase [Bosea sp.]|uniref:pyridoxamine 5'-phosphate oxidase family protein n=1 Tax=Bosea sp. (in: a-proteobacteria) TaxID=1871050 RepID=UPI002382674A|nr:pyridoxamine 5-phosphate oxidase [Bosea sp. (in: a-proteobacteria)]MCP4734361.1 pyridoxamine 5-phosphate oxidase [Bosea sp. (in: a-proteobacteria)]
MTHRFLEIATTPAVKAAQEALGSRRSYARQEEGEPHNHRLGEAEAGFIAARDSFYLASVSETGWPYLQHRGGPAGFLRVLDETTLGFADLRGNRQYLSLGNLTADDRLCLFLMDYGHRARLKIFGRARFHDLATEPELARRLIVPGYRAVPERGVTIKVEAFDWNCPQHITPRFSEAELTPALAPVRQRLEELEVENARLRAELAARAPA